MARPQLGKATVVFDIMSHSAQGLTNPYNNAIQPAKDVGVQMPHVTPLPRAGSEFDEYFATVESAMGFVPNSLPTMARRPEPGVPRMK